MDDQLGNLSEKLRIEGILKEIKKKWPDESHFNKDTMLEYIKAYVRDIGLVNH